MSEDSKPSNNQQSNRFLANVGGSSSLTEEDIDRLIEEEKYEDSLWNDVDDDLDGIRYPEVDETCFAIESNFPPTNLTEEQWNRERS